MSFQTRIETITRQATGLHRNVYVAFVCTFFFGFLIFGGVYQVLVNLLLVRLGFGPEFVGLLNGLGLLFISIGSVLGAVLGQRMSSITLMRAGYFIFSVGMLLFPLASYLPEPVQRGWFLVSYAIGFLMAAVYVVHMNPLIMASTQDEERNKVFSYQAALMTVGGFTGSWLAGGMSAFLVNQFSMSVDSPTPYTWTMLFAAALSVLGVIATFYLTGTRSVQLHQSENEVAEPLHKQGSFPWKIIILVTLVVSLRIVGELGARSFINLYLDLDFSLDPARIAYIYSVAQLLAIPAPLIAPLLMTRYGRGAVFNWATIGVAGCVVLIAFAQQWLWIALSYFVLLGLAQIARPAITIIYMSSVTPKWQASMSSSIIISIGLSGLATSLMGGAMIGSVGFRAFFLATAVITLAGVVIFWFNFLKDAGS